MMPLSNNSSTDEGVSGPQPTFPRRLVAVKLVHSDDDRVARLESALRREGRFLNLSLRVAQLDGAHHAPHGVDLLQVRFGARLELRSEIFQVMAAAERV